MTKEYHEETGATLVTYKAGKAFDNSGYPAKFWACRVVYMYNEIDKVYWVCKSEACGSGLIVDRATGEVKMTSLREVNHLLNHLRGMEKCCQEEYGE